MNADIKKSRGRPARTEPDTRTAAERNACMAVIRRERATREVCAFNCLPDTARVRQPVVELLFSISQTTVWRRVKSGYIPPPRLDGRVASWSVGEIRAALLNNNKNVADVERK